MTLDDDLVKQVDRVSKQLHTNRSAFTRKALREAIARYNGGYGVGPRQVIDFVWKMS